MLKALYGTLAKGELSEFIKDGTFAARIKRCLGRELNSTLELLEEEDDGVWGVLPVYDLYELLSEGWSLDHEWFKWTDDIYRDDEDLEVPEALPKIYTASEQMAAYGLYILNEKILSMGPASESGLNDQGWTREGVLEFEATCLIHAQQALDFAHRLNVALGIPHKETRVQDAMSILGTHNANKRHAAGHAAREFVWAEWQANKEHYDNNKAKFARTYVDIVANKFQTVGGDPLKMTARHLADKWLAFPPPLAGKPYSLLEDR